MTGKPAFFEIIRKKAFQRWNQLEQDPDLAGPWHQLFKQVQSPRHVLSELLQNADDAGATEASVDIEDNCFIFSHNGEDFTEEHFASLCRFGYSNKRALHTIGFRGIGFKSTFSLGDIVELDTPSLSVTFNRQRFTEPRWIERDVKQTQLTRIRVPIRDEHRKKEIDKNLLEWLASPVSLLFFKNIRRMRIGTQDVHWRSLGPGPVPNTEWMGLHENSDTQFLIARSDAEAFPEDALAEIRQERLLGDNQETDFPPCKVEIVLGAKGRLYVVLPTGVETSLPFASNAPFIQDPARLKIKDPDISPTNRWLLDRVGKLAASIMLQWLSRTQLSVADRSNAYDLLPSAEPNDSGLESSCETIINNPFSEVLNGLPALLTNAGELKPKFGSIIIPEDLFGIWSAGQVAVLFDDIGRFPLSRHVSAQNRQKLTNWGVIERINKQHVLNELRAKHLPKPQTWRHLLRLWVYLAPELTGYRAIVGRKETVRIIPVQGKEVLYSANEVVRLGEKRLLQSESDWEFLGDHLLVLNQNWPRFLAEQRRNAEELNEEGLKEEVELAFSVLRSINMENASDVSGVIKQVASGFFTQQGIQLAKCVQLTQIAAKLGSTVSPSFLYVTTDRKLRQSASNVLFDRDGKLDTFFDQGWCNSHFLHPEYTKAFTSCTSEEWKDWVSSGRAGLLVFAPIINSQISISGRKNIEAEIKRRGVSAPLSYPYVTSYFRTEDWDFEENHWRHWTTLSKEEPGIWGRIVDQIFKQSDTTWNKATHAKAFQIATTGSARAITNEPFLASWILKLRELPCLRDTRGFYRKPSELLRRTPETESLMDVEPFIHGHLDNESTRPLLNLLGVRDVPTGPDRLLDCLRALSKANNPPAHEVEKWYRRLDQMIDTCTTNDFANIKQAFWNEKIVLSDGAGWTTASGIFLSSDEEDVPGAIVIRSGVRDLMLWRKINIAERPTADLAIQWLQGLPSGESLSQDDLRRVKSLLARHPLRVWSDCAHWLNLSGQWVTVDTLTYSISMQSLVGWKHLHEGIKQKTADFQNLPSEISATIPFSKLPPLAGKIEDQFHNIAKHPGHAERREWLSQLGVELQRIELDEETEQDRIRKLATYLANTAWQTTAELEIIPYIDGIPAGTPRRAESVWLDGILYVEDRPLAKLARAVAQELGRAFRRPEIADAIKLCFDRTPEFVTEYMEENFKLGPRVIAPSPIGVDELAQPSHNTKDSGSSTSGAELINPISEVNGSLECSNDLEIQREEFDEDAENELEPQVQPRTDHPLPKPSPTPKPVKASIIERFARAQGYKKDSNERFFHSDGSWIAKTHENRFPWEMRAAGGSLVRYYWPKEHCLELEPLQLEADILGLLDLSPDIYALILSDPRGDPVEVSGLRLRTMRDVGEITLHPATYRLVRDHDHHK